MEIRSAKSSRKPRADALRNRDRVLEAAKTVFSAGGSDASLEAVAREAGVGIGTLYRHFPTREALYEAVYRREVEQLGELAEQLKGEASAVDALRRWLRANVEFVDPFEPTFYGSVPIEGWAARGLRPDDFGLGKATRPFDKITPPAAYRPMPEGAK